MKGQTYFFAFLAAAIAVTSSVTIAAINGDLVIQSVIAKSVLPMILAVCPFILASGLVDDKVAVLYGSLAGILMTTLLWGFAILVSSVSNPESVLSTGFVMLVPAMPFIVTSVCLVTALLKRRLQSR